MQPIYHCQNKDCYKPVAVSDTHCQHCKIELDWTSVDPKFKNHYTAPVFPVKLIKLCAEIPSFYIQYNALNSKPGWDLHNLAAVFPPCWHDTLQEALDCILKDITKFNLEINLVDWNKNA